jgi:hypothetical protein
VTFLDAGTNGGRSHPRTPFLEPIAGPLVRLEQIRRILAAAEERDAASDACDASAEQRDRELDLAEMLAVVGTYGDRWPERRAAALDRQRARDDRAASREDRLALARILAEQDVGRLHGL